MSARQLNQSKLIDAVAVPPRTPRLRPVCHAIALMLAAGTTMNAHAATNLANIGAQMSAARNAAAASGRTNLGMSPQQALQASQPSIQNLAHAAQGIAQQIAAQQAAAAAAGTSSSVPNGLAVGGLQTAPGATSNSPLWLNANLPTQSGGANGQTVVNVQQTAQDAILTWQTMNVGRQTTLNFDQSGGNQTNGTNNWVVLNRIEDPSGKPSQILGSINAQGMVLVINRNGILFGAGSQVNVHSLVASSLDVLNANDDLVQTSADIANSNSLFMSGGLAALEAGHTQPGGATAGNPNEILGLGNNVSVSSASDYQIPGDITIAPGASITTHTNGTASDGGLVLVAAPNVTNGGSITATDGQVILAAGIGVSLTPNLANPQILQPTLTGSVSITGTATDITLVSTLTNTGLVQTARGNIDLLGTNVIQNGVVGATTSVSEPGGIVISTVDEGLANTPGGTGYISTQGQITPANGGDETPRAGQLIFGTGSVTTIMPDGDGETATSAPGTTFTPGSIKMTAGSVWFQSGSLIEAPGSTVSVTALTQSTADDAQPPGDTAVQGRIYLDTGATIDVSGLSNVELPIAEELITIPLIGQNELADSPLLRNGFLFGLKDVVVDSTLSGTNPDGSQWVGSPILNLAGYVDLIPRSVDQLLINGGTITLSGAQVMTASGSSLNLNGGYLHYDGGIVNTTRLVDASGAIVPIGKADPFDTYVGIAGEFIESHPRWGVTKDWFDPLLNGGTFESDFIVGGNAGTLNIYASQALVLDGDITAQAFGGSKQVQGNDQPTGGSFNLGAQAASGTLGANPGSIGESGTVILQNSAPQLSGLGSGFSADTPLDTAALNALDPGDPNNILANTVVPTDTLNGAGFSNVSVNVVGGSITVAAGTKLEVQPGGSIELNATGRSGMPTAPAMILGDLIAPSGTISITSAGDIDIGSDALISVAGQWVNNDTQSVSGTVPGDSEFINGGSVTLSTTQTSSGGTAASGTDTTGSIVLQTGSVIDVSSGGEMQANGQMLMQNGIPEGMGGNLSLITYAGNDTSPYGANGAPQLPTDQPTNGRVEMDGTIRSAGFAGGGTLTLQALGFQIGGDSTQAPAWDLVLPADFFAQQGFGRYVLNAMYDTTVASGTTIQLTQRNLLPNSLALQSAASGADLWAGDLTSLGSLDPFHRQATDLVMTAGGYLAWLTPSGTRASYPGVTGAVTVGEGASIVGDAGASIGLGSPAQVTVLGSIIAPGGAITLSADSASDGFALPGQLQIAGGYMSPGKSVWLGSDALLDVEGEALTDPLATPVRSAMQTIVPDTGKVLPGGSVTISDDSGYIVAQSGSVIDVSGASTTFDEPQSSGRYAPQQVWSDAGSITVGGSSGLYFDSTLRAQPGAEEAQGGTLTLLAEQGATAFVVQQSGDLVPAGLTPGSTISDLPAGVLQFAADRLTGSGISTLVLNGAVAVNGSPDAAPVPVVFTGDVNLNLSNSVILETQQVLALRSDQVNQLLTVDSSTMQFDSLASVLNQELTSTTPTAIGAPTVTINAPYVAIVGPVFDNANTPGQPVPVKALADGTLNINASFIDLENQVQLDNFKQANFTSSGDIRLSSTIPDQNLTNALVPGALFTSGNLTFKAADLYPSTGSTFILDAVGPNDSSGNPAPTTITFLPNGTSDVPLSAGGTLLIDATDIVQSGTVRAPSGSLIFGVGNPQDPATLAEFSNLPLVATNSVSLTSGSVTSVSLDGAVVPYGTTVDGVEWQFNPVPNVGAAPDVDAPPSKFVSVNGTSISLNQGATIDLSGGGDLQAEEWVPGTGGSRDLLSQYNVSFATNPSGVAVPVNPGAGNVYAILPGRQSPVAAYDPIFAQTVQPLAGDNGSVSTVTGSIGIGHAALTNEVGQSVYLSGVPGLPAGYYTLLPAKYASLPGAFRVTMSGASGSVLPGVNERLPDGTEVVAGYMGNALDGSHSATPVLFDVQSGTVWQQYSQYTLTSANNFFPGLAAGAGHVTPQLPMDAGHLVIAATTGLSLGATLNAAPADGGAPAEVDIASQDIQVVGSGETALSGYLAISSDQLDALGAGSLLLGGTRTQTDSGITINAIANSLVISNDASDPLTGPEVMLVTKTDSTGTDPNAANGLRIDSGSVIAASGSYPAAKDVPITIGVVPDSTGVGGVSGDGAFLSVSNGGASVVTRVNTTPASSNTGVLAVDAGATLTGGQALTLDSSGNLTFDPSANLSGNIIAVDASAITFTSQTGPAAAALAGFVAGASQIAQLANAQEVILRSSGTMYFDGTVDVTFGNDVDLSAGTYSSNGGSVTINAPRVAFTNETGATASAIVAGPGTLTVNADEIDFGTGDKTISGLSSATFNASGGIVGQGTGTFDFGALPVTLNAPVYLADTSSDATIKTTGVLNLNAVAGTALPLVPVGGALTFVGGTLNDNGATIDAPAGNIGLEATNGDLTIGDGSIISSAGLSKQFFDVTLFAPAGAISLTADTGTINVEAGSTLDFSGANGGGAAGSLTLSAPDQTVQLGGTLKGTAATGYLGGSFSLNTGGAIDLDSLAGELASSGVDDGITVQTNAGNLVLSVGNTIKAHGVSLTADGGPGGSDTSNGYVQILGTIDASGNAGGEIDLYGKSGVDLEGSLIATGSSATQRGGTVNIGTTAIGNNTDINSTYGYENIASAQSGSILLGGNSSIDVSGGTAGGLSGGTVNFRAPLVGTETGPGSVNITITPGAQIKGSRATTVEAYAVWSTDDQSVGPQHFDGIVDPAGWYDSNGNLEAGIFTDQSGNTFTFTPDGTGGGSLTGSSGTTAVTAAQLANGDPDISFGGLTSDFFAPMSTSVNTDHQTFYGYSGGDPANGAGTLMNFVEHGVQGVADQFAGNANIVVVPEIELDNPDPAINGGDISILTNWNLGAGTSASDLAFRFNGQAPVITFRAENNVKVNASLTDGFFQISNPTGSAATIAVPPGFYYGDGTNGTSGEYNTVLLGTGRPFSAYSDANGYMYGVSGPENFPITTADAEQVAQYEAQYNAYFQFLAHVVSINGGESAFVAMVGFASGQPLPGQPTLNVSAPLAGQAQLDATLYLKYLADYEGVFNALLNTAASGGQLPPLQPPPAVLGPVIPGTTIANGTVATDNSPSPVSVAGNALPLLSASLQGGSSTSFRIVAGSDLASSNPLALQAASLFSASSGTSQPGGGSVTLDGHFAYDNATNPNSPNSLTLLAPTMIRTGSGSIEIAAGNDVTLANNDPTLPAPIAPGVIYTAGTPAVDAPMGGGTTIVNGNALHSDPDILVTPAVNPDSGGDISIHAQHDITGVENLPDTAGTVSGQRNGNISQFWWQWMEVGNPVNGTGQITQTSIDFGAFDQGVMSSGGNISISAGGNISDLAVSLPTTWYLNAAGVPVTVGGGNLSVTAGGDIRSGDYFVAKGTGTIIVGGQIESDLSSVGPSLGPVATLLALQDGVLDVSARQGVNIGGVFDPSYIESTAQENVYNQHSDFQGYSSTSGVNISSTTGDIDFGTLGSVQLIGGGGAKDLSYVLPATISLDAFTGGIVVASSGDLFPSATGNLNLIANQSISLSAQNTTDGAFGMLDINPSSMPSPVPSQENPGNEVPSLTDDSTTAHAFSALHSNDTDPVHIYSLNGSIVDGILEPENSGGNAGFYDKLVSIVIDKAALIEAGQDIVNLAFQGQNLRDDDVTRVLAGRDIDDTPLASNQPVIPSLQIGGPGTLDVEAGRNIGPLTSQAGAFSALGSAFPATAAGLATGIEAVGNANNPNLPHESANIQVLFGVGPGIDDANFISTYVNPASSVAGVPSATPALIAFMEQYEAGQGVDTGLMADKSAAQASAKSLNAQEAWSQFQALPVYVQQLFAEQVLFSVLTDVGNDFNNSSSPFFQQYARGYQAINTLFPASLGYTSNDLSGGANGANKLVSTGNLDIRSTTVQTQQGGNVSILGPGGEALIGSTSAPSEVVNKDGTVVAGPGTQGILTLEQGDIDIFTDQSLLLAQSRVFTEQGGGMTIWSSNGDINAGKGAKSVADIPPPQYVCDVNHYCTVDARGEVTGAGIATLQTIPGAQPGDVNLIAPRGTVDAGDAGIRVSGNLNVAALHVANVDNIQVQGRSTGVPVISAVDTGALTAASSAASAATQMAQNLVKSNASGVSQRHWIITVQVEGFGDSTDDGDSNRKKRKPSPLGYQPSTPIVVLGFGDLGDAQRAFLNKAEQSKLGKL
jgi:filamentous hemagglutinin family protein